MHRILTVIGARPNFVKAAIVSKALKSVPNLVETVVHTKQHNSPEMTQALVAELGMDYPTLLPEPFAMTSAERLGNMIYYLSHYIHDRKHYGESYPNYIMVYGDTDSTLVGALVARKMGIPIIHVEAGLRSYNPVMQEESNRILVDHMSDILFAPTQAAMRNLQHEHLQGIHMVGDVMYDASLYYSKLMDGCTVINKFKLTPSHYYLATIHRAETVDDEHTLKIVIKAFRHLAEYMPVVLPMHPRTRQALDKFGISTEGLTVIPPASYVEMQVLEKNAVLILTDSGGVQKEAYFHKVPCVTLRLQTEWSELVNSGWNFLLSEITEEAILSAVASPFKKMSVDDYGDGHASEKIAAIINKLLNKG